MIKRLVVLVMCISMLSVTSVEAFAADFKENVNLQEEILQESDLDEDLCYGRAVTYEELCSNVLSDEVTEFKWVSGFDNFEPLSSTSYLEYKVGEGDTNCAITAVANAFEYFNSNGVKMYDGGFTQEMYTNLGNYIGYVLGEGTYWSGVPRGIEGFARNYNRNVIVDEYLLKLWSDVTRDIGRNRPILLSVPNKVEKKSHMTLVMGYYVKCGQKYLLHFRAIINQFIMNMFIVHLTKWQALVYTS